MCGGGQSIVLKHQSEDINRCVSRSIILIFATRYRNFVFSQGVNHSSICEFQISKHRMAEAFKKFKRPSNIVSKDEKNLIDGQIKKKIKI